MSDRRSKYYNKVIKNKDLKININFDITSLNLMCSYICSNNKNIRRGNIINMRNLFMIMNMDNYANTKQGCLV